MSTLKSTAVLMRLSIGMPGRNRQDRQVTDEVKAEKHFGKDAGRWVKALYPPEALEPITKLDNEARALHARLTLPFDNGVGILPSAVIQDYAGAMKQLKLQRDALVENHFIANLDRWIEWAEREHNGSFDREAYGTKEELREKFYFQTEPLPVPDSTHFENQVTQLLGADVNSVNQRVQDAALEAQRELMRRMIAPVQHMAKVLAKDSPRLFKTLLTNIEDIADLAPKLNLTNDATINNFAKELKELARNDVESFRQDGPKEDARQKAEAMLKKLSGYKL